MLQGLPCRQPHHGTALAARAPFVCCVRSSRWLQGLPFRQPHHGTALAVRAPFVCCVRSSRVLQGLPCRQPHHGTALAARAPCVPSIRIACVCLSQRHSLFCRDCPVGSRTRRLHLCSPCTACVHCAHFKGGGLGLRVSSLAPCFFPTESIDPGPWCSVKFIS